MKSAKIYLAGMYLHLLLSLVIPAGMLFFNIRAGEWAETVVDALFFGYLTAIFLIQLWGWITVVLAAGAGAKGQTALLVASWRLLKLFSIPFFVLNFLYCVLVWGLLVAASRGIFALLLPAPVVITYVFILQTGCVGILCLRQLRRQPPPVPGGVHYLLQIIPVLDVVSTLLVLSAEKKKAASAGPFPQPPLQP